MTLGGADGRSSATSSTNAFFVRLRVTTAGDSDPLVESARGAVTALLPSRFPAVECCDDPAGTFGEHRGLVPGELWQPANLEPPHVADYPVRVLEGTPAAAGSGRSTPPSGA